MKKLDDLKDDDLLIITPEGYDTRLMEKKEFVQSSYYADRENVEVATATEVCASFDLEAALETMEDEMHEDWLGNVMDAIPKDVRKRIEEEINGYLEKEPTYYPKESVTWLI